MRGGSFLLVLRQQLRRARERPRVVRVVAQSSSGSLRSPPGERRNMVGIRPAQMTIVATIAARLMMGFSIAAGRQYPAGTGLQGVGCVRHPNPPQVSQSPPEILVISGGWQKG